MPYLKRTINPLHLQVYCTTEVSGHPYKLSQPQLLLADSVGKCTVVIHRQHKHRYPIHHSSSYPGAAFVHIHPQYETLRRLCNNSLPINYLVIQSRSSYE